MSFVTVGILILFIGLSLFLALIVGSWVGLGIGFARLQLSPVFLLCLLRSYAFCRLKLCSFLFSTNIPVGQKSDVGSVIDYLACITLIGEEVQRHEKLSSFIFFLNLWWYFCLNSSWNFDLMAHLFEVKLLLVLKLRKAYGKCLAPCIYYRDFLLSGVGNF